MKRSSCAGRTFSLATGTARKKLPAPCKMDGSTPAINAVNPELPHYRQIRKFTVIRDVFTPESGLLTAMGKIRRDAINARYASEINAMYDAKGSREAANRQHA